MCRWIQAVVVLAAFVLGQAVARADDVEDFYKGKQINLILIMESCTFDS